MYKENQLVIYKKIDVILFFFNIFSNIILMALLEHSLAILIFQQIYIAKD